MKAQQVARFFTAGGPHRRLVVLDVDGTLHRGLPVINRRGYTNLELIWELLRAFRSRPLRNLRVATAMLALQATDFLMLARHRLGRLTMADRDRILIDLFITRVVRHYNEESFSLVRDRILRHGFPAMPATVCLLAPWCGRWVCISKGFAEVVSAYADQLAIATGRPVEVVANRLDWSAGAPSLAAAPRVLSGEDKAVALKDILAGPGDLDSALVIGDTEEDAAMIQAARDHFGPARVLAVAMHPKDRRIASIADLVVPDWRTLRRLLVELPPSPPVSEPGRFAPHST